MTSRNNDPWVNRMLVAVLGTALCGCIGGAIGLQIKNQPIPGLLTGMGTGAMGALATIVKSSSK
jgi:hypothetical protein